MLGALRIYLEPAVLRMLAPVLTLVLAGTAVLFLLLPRLDTTQIRALPVSLPSFAKPWRARAVPVPASA